MAKCPDHPLCNGKYPIGLMSGDSPKFEPSVQGGHLALGTHLAAIGLKHEPVKGKYAVPEDSYIIHGPTREQLYDLGKKFGQESVCYSDKGRHELIYCNGPNDLKFNPGGSHEHFDKPPEDYYTQIPGAGYTRLNFDFDKLLPAPINRPKNNSMPERTEKSELSDVLYSIAGQLRKHVQPTRPSPHPHAYEWHDGHTDHHPRVSGFGIHLRKDDTTGPSANDQAAGVGALTYHQFAQPYGKIEPGTKTDLTHYPYHGKLADIDRLVNDHGYKPYFAGGKYGRPDLANKNYNTKHLMIYDPTPQSGGDFGDREYTEGWRKIHELAHALTYPEVNKIYGEGRRIGKLGVHRTPNEALRAVHWEHLATLKQRELSKQIGIDIPDETFHKEQNTVMHDAAHRAVTGKFTEPSGEGFTPHKHLVPLDTALGLVKEHAQRMGLLGKSETQSLSTEIRDMADSYSIPEFQQILAKQIQDRIDGYTAEIVELRKKELAKWNSGGIAFSEGSDKPTAETIRGANCPVCNQTEDGCSCVKKAEPLSKPPVSEAQRRAMWAAASGNSTLGIPKKVGKEFATADEGGKLPEKKKTKKSELEKMGISSMLSSNMANNNPNEALVPGGNTGAPLALSEKSHDHLHNWVQDFADASDKGDKRALKSYHRIKSGKAHEGDHERFHSWITDAADKDNPGDRKALEQWTSLRNQSMGVRKSGGDALAGVGAPAITENLMSSEDSSVEKSGNPEYLRREQGTPIPPKDPNSVARKSESGMPKVGKEVGTPAAEGGNDATSTKKDNLGKTDFPGSNVPVVSSSGDKNKDMQQVMTGNSKPQDALRPAPPQNQTRRNVSPTSAQKVTKADVPMAKPPSGKSPSAPPAMSKPTAPTSAAIPKPPSAAPAPKAPGLGGLQKGMLSSMLQGATHGAVHGQLLAHAASQGSPAAVAAGGIAGGIAGAVKGALTSASSRAKQKKAASAPVPTPGSSSMEPPSVAKAEGVPPPTGNNGIVGSVSGFGAKPKPVAPKPAAHAALNPSLKVQPAPSTPPPALPPGAGVSKPQAAAPAHQQIMGKVKGALGMQKNEET